MSYNTQQPQRIFLTNGSRVVELSGGRIQLGRATDCDVRTRDVRASRYHCEIIMQQGGYFVRDLHSTNGTYVNGARVEFTRLEIGDVVSLAGESFLVDSQRREMWERLVNFTHLFASRQPFAGPATALSGSI